MRYYKYPDEIDGIGEGLRFIEVDDKNFSWREVTVSGNFYLGSNILYPYRRLFMSDVSLDDCAFEFIEKIPQNEFEAMWEKHLEQNLVRWNLAKNSYPVGKKVSGVLTLFYPQGVIINLGSAVLGLAVYDDCRRSTKAEYMYPNHKVKAEVKSYDEINQWIILESPIVLAEKVVDYNL